MYRSRAGWRCSACTDSGCTCLAAALYISTHGNDQSLSATCLPTVPGQIALAKVATSEQTSEVFDMSWQDDLDEIGVFDLSKNISRFRRQPLSHQGHLWRA